MRDSTQRPTVRRAEANTQRRAPVLLRHPDALERVTPRCLTDHKVARRERQSSMVRRHASHHCAPSSVGPVLQSRHQSLGATRQGTLAHPIDAGQHAASSNVDALGVTTSLRAWIAPATTPTPSECHNLSAQDNFTSKGCAALVQQSASMPMECLPPSVTRVDGARPRLRVPQARSVRKWLDRSPTRPVATFRRLWIKMWSKSQSLMSSPRTNVCGKTASKIPPFPRDASESSRRGSALCGLWCLLPRQSSVH